MKVLDFSSLFTWPFSFLEDVSLTWSQRPLVMKTAVPGQFTSLFH